MNWPLFWALVLAFGLVIGNIMLLKHAAKLKMPALRAEQPQPTSLATQHQPPTYDQKPNSPE